MAIDQSREMEGRDREREEGRVEMAGRDEGKKKGRERCGQVGSKRWEARDEGQDGGRASLEVIHWWVSMHLLCRHILIGVLLLLLFVVVVVVVSA